MRTLRRRRRRCGPSLPLPRRRPRRHCLKGARSSSTRHPPLDPVPLRGFLLGLFPLSGWVTHSWGGSSPLSDDLPFLLPSEAMRGGLPPLQDVEEESAHATNSTLFPVRQLGSGGRRERDGVWAQTGRRCRAGPDADRSAHWLVGVDSPKSMGVVRLAAPLRW